MNLHEPKIHRIDPADKSTWPKEGQPIVAQFANGVWHGMRRRVGSDIISYGAAMVGRLVTEYAAYAYLEPAPPIEVGDWVRVKDRPEIEPFKVGKIVCRYYDAATLREYALAESVEKCDPPAENPTGPVPDGEPQLFKRRRDDGKWAVIWGRFPKEWRADDSDGKVLARGLESMNHPEYSSSKPRLFGPGRDSQRDRELMVVDDDGLDRIMEIMSRAVEKYRAEHKPPSEEVWPGWEAI